MTLPEAYDTEYLEAMNRLRTCPESILGLPKKDLLPLPLHHENSELSLNQGILEPHHNFIDSNSVFILEDLPEEAQEQDSSLNNQSMNQGSDFGEDIRIPIFFSEDEVTEINSFPESLENEYICQTPMLVIDVTNRTKKYKDFKSKSEEIRYGTKEANFIQEMVNSIRKLNGEKEEGFIEHVKCDLREDFSFELGFVLQKRSKERITENYTTSTFDGNEIFKNLVANLTDYFLTSIFMTNHDVDSATRKALSEFNQTPNAPKGVNRLKDSEVAKIWNYIGQDHSLITDYFGEVIDTYLHEYLENTFQRLNKALLKAMKPITALADLEHAKLDENLSSSVHSMFFKYVKNVVIPNYNYIDDSLKKEIADTVTVGYESFQAIWLIGFRQSIQEQVLGFIKQRLCKLHLYGSKSETKKKSKNEEKKESNTEKKEKSSKKVKLSN